MAGPKTPTRAVLCFHGAGSSGSIFRFQLATLRLALKGEFEYIFVNAPHPSIAGPGMLPVFAGAAPFYRWFNLESGRRDKEMEEIQNTTRDAIDLWEMTKTSARAEIVGVIGFSQGAIAATLLLWQQQLGQLPWFPPVRFAVMICCDFTDEVAAYMHSEAEKHGQPRAVLALPTLHLHGRSDPYLPRGRRMVADHFSTATDVIEFEGGHQCPKSRSDCAKAKTHILRLADDKEDDDMVSLGLGENEERVKIMDVTEGMLA